MERAGGSQVGIKRERLLGPQTAFCGDHKFKVCTWKHWSGNTETIEVLSCLCTGHKMFKEWRKEKEIEKRTKISKSK